MPTYTDSNRHPIHVGNRLGAGGEGTVYEILNHPGLVAKIYKESLSLSRVEKLKVMPSMGTSSLLAMTAWPQGLIYEGGKPCGLLMGRVTGYKDIHNLYSPRGRKIEFAKADFPFLVHAAANLARAFASIHESGTVIGDVNPGGVMVSPTDATVKLIDCDSFQVSSGTRKFLCDVGVPIFTPPELQEKPLKGVLRSANHDNFGLAVLLFHILFMGRHPFSGRYKNGDMPLETSIKEFRFAYGANRSSVLMEPPPNMPDLSVNSPSIAALFEQAFSPRSISAQVRPTALSWLASLSDLAKHLKRCSINSAHAFHSLNRSCPWCEFEVATGAALFNFVWMPGLATRQFDVEVLWRVIQGTALAPLPRIPREDEVSPVQPSATAVQAAAAARNAAAAKAESDRLRQISNGTDRAASSASRELTRLQRSNSSLRNVCAGLGTSSVIICAAVAQYAGALFIATVTVLLVLRLTYLERGRLVKLPQAARKVQLARLDHDRATYIASLAEERTNLATVASDEALAQIERTLKQATLRHRQLTQRAKQLADGRLALEQALDRERLSLKEAHQKHLQIPIRRSVELSNLHLDRKREQMVEHLETFLIDKASRAELPGIHDSLKATLASFNIETAADLTPAGIDAVPGFGPVRTKVLMEWRRSKERQFVFDPSRGVNSSRLAALERKFLGERKQIEETLHNGATKITTAARQFDAQMQHFKQDSATIVSAFSQAKLDKASVPSW